MSDHDYKPQSKVLSNLEKRLESIYSEIKEKQLLMESHLESIAEIEKDYEDALDMIDELRQDKAGKYKNKFNSDREELIRDIESKFGIEYVP